MSDALFRGRRSFLPLRLRPGRPSHHRSQRMKGIRHATVRSRDRGTYYHHLGRATRTPPPTWSTRLIPSERVIRMTQATARHVGYLEVGLGHQRPNRPLQHRPRLPLEGRRRQSPRHPPLHARNGHRSGTGPQSDRVEHGHGLVKMRGPWRVDRGSWRTKRAGGRQLPEDVAASFNRVIVRRAVRVTVNLPFTLSTTTRLSNPMRSFSATHG